MHPSVAYAPSTNLNRTRYCCSRSSRMEVSDNILACVASLCLSYRHAEGIKDTCLSFNRSRIYSTLCKLTLGFHEVGDCCGLLSHVATHILVGHLLLLGHSLGLQTQNKIVLNYGTFPTGLQSPSNVLRVILQPNSPHISGRE